jgi:hypothetical protein
MMLDTATSLLDDFRKLPGRVERQRTFTDFTQPAHFDYDEDLEETNPALQELTAKLATSQESTE